LPRIDPIGAPAGTFLKHMHEFRAGQRYFGKPDSEYRSMGMDHPVEHERTVRPSDVPQRSGAKPIYTYDLGDSWSSGKDATTTTG